MGTEQRRERIVRLVKGRLVRKGRPRLLVSLILAITGLAGFLVSYVLLHTGMTRMWLRYPLAILFAYCVFLLLLRLWLALRRPGRAPDGPGEHDVADLSSLGDPFANLPRGGGGTSDSFAFSGGGGDAGGAGAGGSWGQPSSLSSASSGPSAGGSGGGGGWFDLDDGAFIVVAIAVIAGALIAVLYVVYIAPALLAEILVDGVLVAGLYRELKGVEQRHWLRAAVRKTLVPALVAATLFSVGGYALQRAAPKARSVGEVFEHLAKD